MRRRDLVRGMAAALGLAGTFMCAGAWARGAISAVGVPESRWHIRRVLAALLNAELAPQRVGHRYLALHPEEIDIDRLWTTLAGLPLPSHIDQLKARLAQLRRRDFERGEIVIVDGWILARTEARACALLTLI